MAHCTGRVRGRGYAGHERTFPGRHLRGGAKRGACIGATKCGKGVKIEIVTDAQGIPIGLATDAASVPEVEMAGPAVAGIPASVEIPAGTPLIGDKAYDSDPLRDELDKDEFILISPQRDNRPTDQRWSSLASLPTTLDCRTYLCMAP